MDIDILFDSTSFPPRWECGTWSAIHGWTHIISDIMVFLAYTAIPFALGYFVKKRTDLPFPKIFYLFSLFIFACGTVHLIEATIFWIPWYRFSALVKLVTAIVSWWTVAALLPVIPLLLKLRSPEELEREVAQRTHELNESNLQLQLKNEELQQFVYTVSHDLKSPLVTSSGFLGVLREDLEAGQMDEIPQTIARLEAANLRMKDLIEDILELSRLGQVIVTPETVQLSVVVGEVIEDLQPSIQAAGAAVRVTDQLPSIRADRHAVYQVFENLMTNALKYGCSAANPTISIGCERIADRVRCFVRDNGPGISVEYHERVLRPFERLDSRSEGSGVGLAIVKRIMESYGGSVSIESVEQRGATFWLELPGEDSN